MGSIMLKQTTRETGEEKQEDESKTNPITQSQTGVEQAVASVEKASVTEQTQNPFERRIAALDGKMASAPNAAETQIYCDTILAQEKQKRELELQELKLKAELESKIWEQQRQRKQDAKTQTFQLGAALVSGAAGTGLVIVSVMIHDPTYAALGTPLIAISAAALSERAATVAASWLSGKGGKSDNDKK